MWGKASSGVVDISGMIDVYDPCCLRLKGGRRSLACFFFGCASAEGSKAPGVFRARDGDRRWHFLACYGPHCGRLAGRYAYGRLVNTWSRVQVRRTWDVLRVSRVNDRKLDKDTWKRNHGFGGNSFFPIAHFHRPRMLLLCYAMLELNQMQDIPCKQFFQASSVLPGL